MSPVLQEAFDRDPGCMELQVQVQGHELMAAKVQLALAHARCLPSAKSAVLPYCSLLPGGRQP